MRPGESLVRSFTVKRRTAGEKGVTIMCSSHSEVESSPCCKLSTLPIEYGNEHNTLTVRIARNGTDCQTTDERQSDTVSVCPPSADSVIGGNVSNGNVRACDCAGNGTHNRHCLYGESLGCHRIVPLFVAYFAARACCRRIVSVRSGLLMDHSSQAGV